MWIRTGMRAIGIPSVLVVLAGLTALLVVGCSESPGGGQAKAPALQVPSAASESQTKSPAPSEPPVDLDRVPEGDADTVLNYLRQVERVRLPPGASREEQMAHIRRVAAAQSAAADRLLSMRDLKADAREQALLAKMGSLRLLYLTDAPEGEQHYVDFLQEHAASEQSPLAAMARRQLLSLRLGRALRQGGTAAEVASIVAELHALLQSPLVDKADLQLAGQVGRALESTGHYEAARSVYESVASRFAASPRDLARMAEAVSQSGLRRMALIGQPVELVGTLVDGQPLDWSQYRGKVVLIDFWATWCGPCIEELPNVVENYRRFHERGFDVLGISLDEDAAKLQQFLHDRQIPWATVFPGDPAQRGFDGPLPQQFGVDGIPATYLVDRQGRVVDINLRGPRLGEALARLLATAP